MQPDNQVVSVLPTFLEEGKVADVEEVKGSRHIDYPVTLLWTLTEDIKWKNSKVPCSWRTRGVSGWLGGTGRVPSREISLLLLCSSQRRLHGQPGVVVLIVLASTE